MTDRKKMVKFIESQLPDGVATLILGHGPDDYDAITADVMVDGDDLDISNCPEWVSVRDVYEHLHWRMMPGWEQTQLLRNQLLASRAADFKARCTAYAATATLTPYRFEKIGELWVVHFTVVGDVEIGIFNDHRGFQHLSALLANEDRDIESIQLDGRTDEKTMEIIASERNKREKYESGDLTIHTLKDAFAKLNDNYAAALENGDLDGMSNAEQEIDKFKTIVGNDDKDYYRYLRQQYDNTTLDLTIHRTVATAIRRALCILRTNHMKECADFLKSSVNPEGYTHAYRPQLLGRPNWSL